MPLELRRSFVAATGLATIVIVALCYWVVRDTINAASQPVQVAFSVLLISSYGGMFLLLHRLLPLLLVRLWPALDR